MCIGWGKGDNTTFFEWETGLALFWLRTGAVSSSAEVKRLLSSRMKTFCLQGWLLVKMLAFREPGEIKKREYCCIPRKDPLSSLNPIVISSRGESWTQRFQVCASPAAPFAVILGGSRLLSVFPAQGKLSTWRHCGKKEPKRGEIISEFCLPSAAC